MKRIAYVVAMAVLFLAFPGLLMAQTNPVVGSWTLNLEKSKLLAAPSQLGRDSGAWELRLTAAARRRCSCREWVPAEPTVLA